MRIKNFIGISFLPLILSITACDNNTDNEKENPVQQGVAINSISATSNVDLSGRNEWLFRVGYGNPTCKYYDYTLKGNKLYALADKENVYHFSERKNEGDVLGVANRVVFYFQDKRYFLSTSNRSMGPEGPNILDQSTEELFLIADRLEANYIGIVRNDISDVIFTHANTLIEFEIEGISENAEVYVQNFSYAATKPLKVGANSYKAIVCGSASIGVKISDDFVKVAITNKFNPNTCFKVKTHWDSINKKLIINEIKEEEWR